MNELLNNFINNKKDFIEKLKKLEFNENDIFMLTKNYYFIEELFSLTSSQRRLIINYLELYTDVERLNNLQHIKNENEIKEINEYTTEEKLIINILNSYMSFENLKDLLEMFNINKEIKENILKEYKYYDKFEMIQKYINKFDTNKKKVIIENVIDLLFEDISYNVFVNIKELLNYYKNTNDINILNEKKYTFYKNIVLIRNKSIEEIINFYKEYKDFYTIEDYYNDFRNAKNHSYTNIKKSLIKKNELKNNYIVDGVEIHELNGEDFKSLVHVTNYIKKQPIVKWENNKSVCTSVSLIDNYKLNCYKSPKEYYAFGFETFEESQIIHTFNSDSFSSYTRNMTLTVTNKINELHTPDSINRGVNYNEIVIMVKNPYLNTDINDKIKELKPSYLVCFDEVTENDIITAKNMNIYILKINTQKYRIIRSRLYDEDFLTNNYITKYDEVSKKTI